MQKFIQYTPTEILFGENTQAEVGKEVKKWGGSRVFIVYGGGSVKKSGLLAQVEEALEKEGLAYEEFGGEPPEVCDHESGSYLYASKISDCMWSRRYHDAYAGTLFYSEYEKSDDR